MMHRTTALASACLLSLGLCLGCGDTPKPPAKADTAAADGSAPKSDLGDASATPPATTAPQGALPQMLEWLDPDAVGAATVNLPEGIDVEALVSVFAIPPRAEQLLEAAVEIDPWLARVVPDEHPPETWLGDQALAVTGTMSAGPTVIRPMLKPKAEVAKLLSAGDFDMQTVEGFEVFYPKKSFPYRIALLDESVLAFIPAREAGSGLSPLTAGRDLPTSELQKQLETAHATNDNVYVELFVAGPMMHFDLDPPLVGARFELVEWEAGGIEGRILVQPVRETAACMDVLEKRVPVGETDRIVQLADDVAYQLDKEFIVGVLRLSAADSKALEAAP